MAETGPRSPQGLASADFGELRQRVLGAWDAFVGIAEAVDPGTPTRLPGWSAREVVLHLGRWSEEQPLQRVLDSARAGGHGTISEGSNDEVVAAHADATWVQILDALRRARDGVEDFLATPQLQELGALPSASILGPLPVLTIVNAGPYELAVHAVDLGVRDVPDVLLPGLAAITDITGALVSRQGMTATATGQTPWGGWRMVADPTGWRTEPVAPGKVGGVAVMAAAADLLDVAAGRAFGPSLLAQRRIKVQDLRRFLMLAPIVEAVPGIPGGVPLRAAAKLLSGAAGLLGKIPGIG